MEWHKHQTADLVPPFQFATADSEGLQQVQPVAKGQGVKRVEGAHDHPHRHHIRVGVVVDAVIGAIGVTGVELIRPDHTADDVAPQWLVELRPAHPEPGYLGEHLGAVGDEVLQIAGHLVVLPDVVGHRDSDVVGPCAGIGVPTSGVRIEVQLLTFFPAVAARLPREHRSRVSGIAGGAPGRRQPALAVAKQ